MEEIKRQLNEEEYLEYIEVWKLENKELIDSGKCRKIFLEGLPKGGIQIKWGKSIGYRVYFIYEDITGLLFIIDYNNKNSKLLISYNDNEFYMHISGFQQCKLGKNLGKITTEFKVKIGDKFKDNNRDIIIIDREHRVQTDKNGWNIKRKWYKYHCNKDGYEDWIIEGNLLYGYGCPVCHNLVVVQGINDIPTTAPWLIPYFQGGYEEAKLYTPQSNKSIYPICPHCGIIKDKATVISNIYYRHNINCPVCSDGFSYPEKIMFNVFSQLNVDFETEYSPEWIKPRRYDNYFIYNGKEYILEMDGGFHFKNNSMNGQTKEQSKAIDDYKDMLAKEHGIEVIRIDCDYGNNESFKYIRQNILNSKLNKLFDLNNINWVKIEKLTMSNLVKMVCNYKKNNPNMSIVDISNTMKFSPDTIRRWLKRGINSEICNIDINGNPITITRGKFLICINNNKIFKSSSECEQQSFKIFGKKLNQNSIARVCRGERNHYKGYEFKYIENLTEEELIKYNIKNRLKQLNKTA